nr:MAG TPA: hypothetical protein [Caudoviricetes sp.]
MSGVVTSLGRSVHKSVIYGLWNTRIVIYSTGMELNA